MPERAHSSVLHTPKHVRISVLYMPKQVLQCTSTITHLPCHINARRALFARVKNSSKNRLVEDAHAQTRTHFNHQVLNYVQTGSITHQAYTMVYVPWYKTVRKTNRTH